MFEFTYSLRNERSRITKAFLHSDRARIETIAKKIPALSFNLLWFQIGYFQNAEDTLRTGALVMQASLGARP